MLQNIGMGMGKKTLTPTPTGPTADSAGEPWALVFDPPCPGKEQGCPES